MLSPTKDLVPNHFRHSIEVVVNLRIQEPEDLDLRPGPHPPLSPLRKGGKWAVLWASLA